MVQMDDQMLQIGAGPRRPGFVRRAWKLICTKFMTNCKKILFPWYLPYFSYFFLYIFCNKLPYITNQIYIKYVKTICPYILRILVEVYTNLTYILHVFFIYFTRILHYLKRILHVRIFFVFFMYFTRI